MSFPSIFGHLVPIQYLLSYLLFRRNIILEKYQTILKLSHKSVESVSDNKERIHVFFHQ